jgi:preprotein translocase subunit SecG
MGGFATAGQTANALTRTTAICATLFFITSLTLAILAGTHHKAGSMLDSLDNPPPVTGDATPDASGATPSTTPTDKAGDKGAENLDSKAPVSDKDLPKASDEPKPQSGAPSAPISE